MEVNLTHDEIIEAVKHCSGIIDGGCKHCPLEHDSNCQYDLVNDVNALIEAYNDAIDHRNMVIQTVKAALDKGGFSVTVNPDGTVMCHPWQDAAQWVEETDRILHWHCSKCGFVTGTAVAQMQYCPHCGSFMENYDELTSGVGQAFSPD